MPVSAPTLKFPLFAKPAQNVSLPIAPLKFQQKALISLDQNKHWIAPVTLALFFFKLFWPKAKPNPLSQCSQDTADLYFSVEKKINEEKNENKKTELEDLKGKSEELYYKISNYKNKDENIKHYSAEIVKYEGEIAHTTSALDKTKKGLEGEADSLQTAIQDAEGIIDKQNIDETAREIQLNATIALLHEKLEQPRTKEALKQLNTTLSAKAKDKDEIVSGLQAIGEMTLTHLLKNPNSEITQTLDQTSEKISTAISAMAKYEEEAIQNLEDCKTKIKSISTKAMEEANSEKAELIVQGQNRANALAEIISDVSTIYTKLSTLGATLTNSMNEMWSKLPRMEDELKDMIYNITREEKILNQTKENLRITSDFLYTLQQSNTTSLQDELTKLNKTFHLIQTPDPTEEDKPAAQSSWTHPIASFFGLAKAGVVETSYEGEF